jgi:uncharacterized protein (DUF427 family)
VGNDDRAGALTQNEKGGTRMSGRMKIPDERHPITVSSASERVRVELDGRIIADSADVLVLREAGYRPVYYLPLADLDQTLLRRSPRATYCPYKGDASYYSIVIPGGAEVADAIWEYKDPYPAVTEIAGRVAFYPEKVEISTTYRSNKS